MSKKSKDRLRGNTMNVTMRDNATYPLTFLTYFCSFSPLGEEERGLDDGPRHLPVSLQPVVDQRRPRGGDDAARSVIISPS